MTKTHSRPIHRRLIAMRGTPNPTDPKILYTFLLTNLVLRCLTTA